MESLSTDLDLGGEEMYEYSTPLPLSPERAHAPVVVQSVEKFDPLTYEGKCDSIIKISLHVFLAALVGSLVPVDVVGAVVGPIVSRVPGASVVTGVVTRPLFVVIVYLVISKLLGVLF